MADQLLEKARETFEGQITKDFEGQRLAEWLTTAILVTTGLVAFASGYVKQDIYTVAWVGLAGTALAFVLIIPPWPVFNRHPVTWLPPSHSITGFNIEVDGKKVS